jgi:PAS domain-containing protein
MLAGAVLVVSLIARGTRWGRLELCLAIDAAGVAALWWLFGPVAAVDFVLFYVVATAALLLPLAPALRIMLSLLVVTLIQLVLHLPGISGSLPVFHQDEPHGTIEEIVFRAILVVGAAVMFFTIANMLRRSQAAIEESEQRFRSLVEATPDAIVVHDGSEILFANPAGARLVGAQTPEDILGGPFGRLIHPHGSGARPRPDRRRRCTCRGTGDDPLPVGRTGHPRRCR